MDGFDDIPKEESAGWWRVWRHGGSSNHRWVIKHALASGNVERAEEQIRTRYAKLRDTFRQGHVALMDPEGEVIERTTFPRVRSRW